MDSLREWRVMFQLLALVLAFFSHPVFSISNQELIAQLNTKEIKRIAFGSCNFQNDKQTLWKDIIKQAPDLFIWGGDIIYADWDSRRTIEEAYRTQSNIPDYVLLRSFTPILGTWDDHDFGYNNADGRLSYKTQSQKYFLDFLEEPQDSPRRLREGVYTSYEIGKSHKIKIILLDNRYFKDLEKDAPMLGKKQWEWLESELKDSKASMHIIMTGLSIFSRQIKYTEEWAEKPVELNRMLDLMRKYKPKGVLFLSGDKHFSSIFQRYGQVEFMSSGMTHVADRRTWVVLGRLYPVTYFGKSYGQIDISWEGETPLLNLSMRSEYGKDVHPTKLKWDQNRWVYLNSPITRSSLK